LPEVVTIEPTVRLWGTTVVNVIAPDAKVAAVIVNERPLTVAVPATVRPRSRKPIVVAGPGSAPAPTTKVDEFGTDETVVLMLNPSGTKLFVLTVFPATSPWSPAEKNVIAALPVVFETTPFSVTGPGVI
jgi:hypothetical protein